MTTKENESLAKSEKRPSFAKEFNGLPVEIDYDGAGRPFPSVIVDGHKFSLGVIKSMIPGGNIVEHIQNIRNLSARDDDVLICTYLKSGTHWIWEIVFMLRKGKAEYNTKIKETAMLEFLSKDQIEALESPRILNTHFPLHMLPKDLLEKKRKIIQVMRNPKDIVVSMYNHSKSMRIGVSRFYSGTFSDYLSLFYSLEGVAKGGWNKYVRDFEKFVKDNPDYPILTLYFEDIKQDPKKEITKVAKFLDVSYTEELITAVTEKCEFENLKKANKEIKDDYISRNLGCNGKQFIYRKGTVGDWKNWFTVAQNELFDETFERWMSGSELKFKFSL
ncbi:hypothetical protein CHS0354_013195 [Potamilus streckersoni]|uniref:Sulfotransferase domain-containing protein n=1 Tax=Potamilus streckersoni TaxID=2493646 RepID=A0AAE0T902_9BIVA|nr:hypothetical protein CHS0354_013195 [Potamilus streckersoni]